MCGGMIEAICPRMSPGRMFMMLYYYWSKKVGKLFQPEAFIFQTFAVACSMVLYIQ